MDAAFDGNSFQKIWDQIRSGMVGSAADEPHTWEGCEDAGTQWRYPIRAAVAGQDTQSAIHDARGFPWAD